MNKKNCENSKFNPFPIKYLLLEDTNPDINILNNKKNLRIRFPLLYSR